MRLLRRSLIALILSMLILPVAAQTPGSGGVFPPPQWATEEIFAIVAVPRANVRTAPSVETGLITRVITIGQRYAVRGFVDEQDWWLLEIGGELGWVSFDGILVTNNDRTSALDGPLSLTAAQEASIDAQIQLAQTQVAATANVNIRQGPSIRTARIGLLPFNDRANIVGRNAFGTWLLIDYRGVLGWVSAPLVVLPFGLPLDAIPVAQ